MGVNAAVMSFLSPAVRVPWMPPDGALHGQAVDRLMYIDLAALLACFLLAHALLLYAVLRKHRRRRNVPSPWAIETTPLILLVALYIWMAVTAEQLWAKNRFEGPSPDSLQIEVVGVQFQWYFRYPGADAAFGATRPELVSAATGNPLGIDPQDSHGDDDWVASELVLPVGREVDVRLRSLDVIHGFFIPGMRLKQNAVPGEILHIHFTPTAPGEYPILCSQVCGLGHGRMQAHLRVLSSEEFALWQKDREARLFRRRQGQ
jgi:cytochrome c oxidase subunit II